MGRFLWTGIAGVVALAATAVALLAGVANSGYTTRPSDARISPQATMAISRTLGADEPAYHARQVGAGFELENAAQGFSARLTRAGATISLSGGKLSLAPPTGTASAPVAHGNRVSIGGLGEWFANGPAGLEQGFTLTNPSQTTIALGLGGSLRPRLALGGIDFTGASGRPLLRYGDLTVTDARGRAVPSWLALRGDRLLIRVDGAGATYPLAVDPILNESAKLTASDGAATDELGWAVAVSGSTIAVGAPNATVAAGAAGVGTPASKGAVYVFTEPVGGWSSTDAAPLHEAAKLITSNSGQQVGYAVAINSSTIVATARSGDQNSSSGDAYVWAEPQGGWTGGAGTPEVDTAELTTSGAQSVAISGSTLAVGTGAGVDVYTEPAGGWGGTIGTPATLTFSGGPAPQLGQGVAISGSTIVAGAPGVTVTSVTGAGAAFVFTEPQGGWSGTIHQVAELTPSNPATNESFGESVGIDGATIAVGAPFYAGLEDGGAYVFTEPAGGWSGTLTESARLLGSNTTGNARLGNDNEIAVQGDEVIAGAQGDSAGKDQNGAVYVFTKPAGGWSGTVSETAEFVAKDGGNFDEFGSGAAISGATIVGGAQGASDNSGTGPGAAYVFTMPTLTVATAGTGTGTVTGGGAGASGGIACPGTCSLSAPPGVAVTLTAAPAAGSTFTGWSGGGCSGTGTCAVTLNANNTVTATFTKKSSTTTPPPPPAPSCTLRPGGSTASTKGVLTLSVKCTQSVSATLAGKVTVHPKRKHGAKKTPKAKTYSLKSARGTGSTLTLSVKLPGAALSALKHGAAESIAFTLTGTNANGTAHAGASIKHVKLAHRKH